MSRRPLAYGLSLVALLSGVALWWFNRDPVYEFVITFEPRRIAHAGGGLENGRTYSNSFQALDFNIARHFTYFEIDFVFTSDDALVCLHDWEGNFKRTFGFKTPERLSLVEFEKISSENPRFTNCTLQSLAGWMQENPSAVLVTDVKERNLEALEIIRGVVPDSARRVIPQVYQPENYETVRRMGFEQIIWTLYRYSGDREEVLEELESFQGSFAVTMPTGRAKGKLPRQLGALGVPTYVHTINSAAEATNYFENGVSEIYTDFLQPELQPEEGGAKLTDSQ